MIFFSRNAFHTPSRVQYYYRKIQDLFIWNYQRNTMKIIDDTPVILQRMASFLFPVSSKQLVQVERKSYAEGSTRCQRRTIVI